MRAAHIQHNKLKRYKPQPPADLLPIGGMHVSCPREHTTIQQSEKTENLNCQQVRMSKFKQPNPFFNCNSSWHELITCYSAL